MGKQRKVNEPASRRRNRMRPREPKGRHRLESEAIDTGVRFFLLLAAAVVVALAGIVALWIFVPRLIPRDVRPWETYQDQMVEDPARSLETGKQTFVYSYRPREVKDWLAGVRDRQTGRGHFRTITSRAVELLAADDAARVLEAAAKAHPDWRDDLSAGAATVAGRLSSSVPEERELRARLEAALAPE